MRYIHELKNWPNFTWDQALISKRLAETRLKQGLLLGRMQSVGFEVQESATLQMLTEDVLKSSAIEGEKLNHDSVRSSVARKLGIDIAAAAPKDRNVDGVVEMMMDATQNYKEAISADRLFAWQSSLFPAGRSGLQKIEIGKWRTDKHGAMQVISGASGREKVHFEAPSADRLKTEMATFLKWFTRNEDLDLVLKAAIAHFWFVTIHPFSDGNGRIARAITDLCLAKSEQSSKRFYSLSSQIQVERESYYDILEQSQKGDLDITDWLIWFFDCFERALDRASKELTGVLQRSSFWSDKKEFALNPRQRKIVTKLLEGFDGKLTSTKYMKLAKCSQDTATRDINDLIDKKILKRDAAGGRSTSYSLVL